MSDCLSGYCTLGETCVAACASGEYPNGQGVCNGSCNDNNPCPTGNDKYCDQRGASTTTCGPSCVGTDSNGNHFAPDEFYYCGGPCDTVSNFCAAGCCSGPTGSCYKGTDETECNTNIVPHLCSDCSGSPGGTCAGVGSGTRHCQ